MKRAFTLVELIIVVAIILILAVILFPVLNHGHGNNAPRSSCQANLKQIGLGFMQYVQDYDERFPPARLTSSTGWADGLQPYVKSTQLFQCPSAPNGATATYTTDYFYNRRLARVFADKLNSSSLTILSGDGPDNAVTWSSLSQLPVDATTNSDSFAQRHLEGANYGFADGHVKWFKPEKITNAPVKEGKPTFATR